MAPRRSCIVKGEGVLGYDQHTESAGRFGPRISISRWIIDFLEGNEDFEKSIYPHLIQPSKPTRGQHRQSPQRQMNNVNGMLIDRPGTEYVCVVSDFEPPKAGFSDKRCPRICLSRDRVSFFYSPGFPSPLQHSPYYYCQSNGNNRCGDGMATALMVHAACRRD